MFTVLPAARDLHQPIPSKFTQPLTHLLFPRAFEGTQAELSTSPPQITTRGGVEGQHSASRPFPQRPVPAAPKGVQLREEFQQSNRLILIFPKGKETPWEVTTVQESSPRIRPIKERLELYHLPTYSKIGEHGFLQFVLRRSFASTNSLLSAQRPFHLSRRHSRGSPQIPHRRPRPS